MTKISCGFAQRAKGKKKAAEESAAAGRDCLTMGIFDDIL